MMENQQPIGKVKVFFAKNYFYLGDYIKGDIEIITDKISVVTQILIEIYAIESWKVKEKEDEEPNKMNSKKKIVTFLPYLNQIKNFQITDNGLILPIGKNIIPFQFRFSEENSPIFEFPLPSKRAYIRYEFRVDVETSLGHHNNSFFLCLISRPIMDQEKILTKSVNMPIKKWKMFEKGETIFKVTLPENNFKFDSICKVIIDIDNTKGKANTKEYKINLRRTVTFKDNTGNIKYVDEFYIIQEQIPAVVKTGQSGQFEYELTFKEKNIDRYNYTNEIIPYKIQLENINFFMPTVHGDIISCDYEIKVTLYFDCFVAFADRPRIEIPIYLVHQTPMEYQLQIQQQIEYENNVKKAIDQSQREKIEKEEKENEINNLMYNKIPINVDDNNKNDDNDFNLMSNKMENNNIINNNIGNNNIIDNKENTNNKTWNNNIVDNKEQINNNLIDNKNEIKNNNNNLNIKKEIPQNSNENNSDEDDEDDEEDDESVPSLDLINKAKEEKMKKSLLSNQKDNKNNIINPPSNSQNVPLPSNKNNSNIPKKEDFSLFD